MEAKSGKVSGGVKGQRFLVGTLSSQEVETQAILSAVSADITNYTSLYVVLGSLHKDYHYCSRLHVRLSKPQPSDLSAEGLRNLFFK